MDSVDDRITRIQDELSDIRLTLNEIHQYVVDTREDMTTAKVTIDKVASEVMPTIDNLLKSPMLKMLLPKDKK